MYTPCHLQRKKAVMEKTREEVNKKLPPSLSSDSGNSSLSSSHYSDKKDPNLFINIPDVAIPVDYSLPNTPDGEYPTKTPDSSSANDTTQRPYVLVYYSSNSKAYIQLD